jgi:hypothetical protein
LTRATQPHAAQPDRNHVTVENRRGTVLGEQRDLFGFSVLVEHFDHPAPGGPLAVVDLAEIEHLPLNHAPARNAPVLDHRPGPMLFAILAANLVAQKHAPDSRRDHRRARALVGTTDDSQTYGPMNSIACRSSRPRKSLKLARVGEVGLVPRFAGIDAISRIRKRVDVKA